MLLNYKSTGEGKPVILIHGLFGSLDNLGLLGKALSSHYRVIQIDLPNHGMSYQPPEFTYQSLAADVLALLDHLDLEKTVLIGHSMGGKVAMALAQQHPERVEKLIVLDMAPYDYGVHRHKNVFAGLTASQKKRWHRARMPKPFWHNILLSRVSDSFCLNRCTEVKPAATSGASTSIT